MGSKISPSAPVCSHSPDAIPIDPSVHQVFFKCRPPSLRWTTSSSATTTRGPWHGVIGWSSRWHVPHTILLAIFQVDWSSWLPPYFSVTNHPYSLSWASSQDRQKHLILTWYIRLYPTLTAIWWGFVAELFYILDALPTAQSICHKPLITSQCNCFQLVLSSVCPKTAPDCFNDLCTLICIKLILNIVD